MKSQKDILSVSMSDVTKQSLTSKRQYGEEITNHYFKKRTLKLYVKKYGETG